MATKKNDKAALQQERQEKIEETVSKTEQFYNENKKTIWGCIIAAAVIALGVLAYNQFYLKPKVAEAQEQAYPAEAAFRAGNFEDTAYFEPFYLKDFVAALPSRKLF